MIFCSEKKDYFATKNSTDLVAIDKHSSIVLMNRDFRGLCLNPSATVTATATDSNDKESSSNNNKTFHQLLQHNHINWIVVDFVHFHQHNNNNNQHHQ